MTTFTPISVADLTLVEPASTPSPNRPESTSSAEELSEATRLVEDLAALVEAGLVVVRKPLGGPARYGPAHPDGEAGRSRVIAQAGAAVDLT